MWKKILLILGCLVLIAIVVGGAGITWLFLRKPAMAPPSSIKVAITPERVARGRYIFVSVADCGRCHSEHDYSRFGYPEVQGGRAIGNDLSEIVKELRPFGIVVAPNLTPDIETGLGTWTDGEKIRAIRDGVDKNGRALFPAMPYQSYRRFCDDDVQALVAFLDCLPPVHHPLPQTKLNFPVSLLIKSFPQPSGSVSQLDRSDAKRYGEYLVAVAACENCHTPVDGSFNSLPGKKLAGGTVFDHPEGKVVSANITPDLETGIGKWSEEFFQKKFYDYKDYAANGPPPVTPQSFTVMPWLAFSGKDPEDLSAIYAYLRSVPPVHNPVEVHPGFPKVNATP